MSTRGELPLLRGATREIRLGADRGACRCVGHRQRSPEKERLLATLSELEERVRQEIREIDKASEVDWHDLEIGADKAWNELRQAIEPARSPFS